MSTAAVSDSKWFGAGYIYGIQTVAPGGVPASLLLPGAFATIQDANVDITKTVKELRGAFEDAEDIADGPRKITGKVSTGRVQIELINNLIFAEPGGGNFTTGTTETVNNSLKIVDPILYTVTGTPPAPGVFLEDLGVTYFGTRLSLEPLLYVASPLPTPTAGQYYCNPATGVYTFNSSDASAKVLISYRYTNASVGHTLVVNNLIMGSSRPGFSALFMNPYDGDQEILLYYCKCTKLSFAIKSEDYTKIDIEFMAAANTSGQTIEFLSSF